MTGIKNEEKTGMTEEEAAKVMESAGEALSRSEIPIETLGLLYTESGDGAKRVYQRCVENVARILENHPEFKGKFRYDAWRMVYETFTGKEWKEIDDRDIRTILTGISAMYPQFRLIGKDMAFEGIMAACERNTIDTALDWLRSLRWDGGERLEAWLDIVYGCGDSPYIRAAGSNWFKGLAKRIAEPGCQFDHVLMLKGRQGCGKTTSLRIIGGQWHLETTMNADSKDFFLQFRGAAVIELAEGSTMSNTDVKKLKAVISGRVDRYREPYGRTTKDVPRRCVFAMTTNEDQPLRDDTGNRRFLPVEVLSDHADIEWLAQNRDQLYAEAYHRAVRLREPCHEFPPDTERIQEESVEESPYLEKIRSWISDAGMGGGASMEDEGYMLHEVWQNALSGESSRFDMRAKWLVGKAMKQLGFEKRQYRNDSGKREKKWFRAMTG